MKTYRNTSEKFGNQGPFEAESTEELADGMMETFREWAIQKGADDVDSAVCEMREEFIDGLEVETKNACEYFDLNIMSTFTNMTLVGDGTNRFWVISEGLDEEIEIETDKEKMVHQYDDWCVKWISAEDEIQIKVAFQDDSNGRGWIYFDRTRSGWMPVVGCDDADEIPTLENLKDQNHAGADDFSDIDIDACENHIRIEVVE